MITQQHKVNCPSSNTNLSLNIFQYFSNSLAKLSDFCAIGCINCRAKNVVLSVKSKGATKITQEEKLFASIFLKR